MVLLFAIAAAQAPAFAASTCITDPGSGGSHVGVSVDIQGQGLNIDYSPQIGEALVTSDYGSGKLVAAIGNSTRTLFLNSMPDDIVADPDPNPHTNPAYKLGYVSLYTADAVAIIDMVTAATIKTLRVGRNPRGLALDNTKRLLFVANQGGRSISVIDINKSNASFLNVIRTLSLNGSPQYLAADAVNGLLYAGLIDTKAVAVIETATFRTLNLSQGAACGSPPPYTPHIYMGTTPGHMTYGSINGTDAIYSVDNSNNLWSFKAVNCGNGLGYYSKSSTDLTYAGQQCGPWDLTVDEFSNSCTIFGIPGSPAVPKLYITCQTSKSIGIVNAATPLNAGSMLGYMSYGDCAGPADTARGIVAHPFIACKYFVAFQSGIMCDALSWGCSREQVDDCMVKHKADPATYDDAAVSCAVCCYVKQSYTACQPASCP